MTCPFETFCSKGTEILLVVICTQKFENLRLPSEMRAGISRRITKTHLYQGVDPF
jgi:hypothetical protein